MKKLTRKMICEMEAGQELDALVAERVMRQEPCEQWLLFRAGGILGPEWAKADTCNHANCYPLENAPHYSTNIAAAWEVIEKLNQMKLGWFSLEQFGEKGQGVWRALIWSGNEEDSESFFADANTVPLAICRAALYIFCSTE